MLFFTIFITPFFFVFFFPRLWLVWPCEEWLYLLRTIFHFVFLFCLTWVLALPHLMPDILLYQAPRGDSWVCCQTNDYYHDIFAVPSLLYEVVLLDWAPQGQSKNQRICPTSFEHTEGCNDTGVLMQSKICFQNTQLRHKDCLQNLLQLQRERGDA